MEQALRMTAEDFSGEFIEKGFVSEYADRDHQQCDWVIRTPELKRGFGCTINKDGRPVFVGDPYGVGHLWQEMEQRVTQHYSVLALRASAAELGWPVDMFVKPDGTVSMDLVVE